jgi:hypothetical protein
MRPVLWDQGEAKTLLQLARFKAPTRARQELTTCDRFSSFPRRVVDQLPPGRPRVPGVRSPMAEDRKVAVDGFHDPGAELFS